MGSTKRRMELFSFYDRTGIQAHLEKMAQKGWFLEKIGSLLWRYKKGEPRRLRYFVTYYPEASGFDPAPSEGEQSFQKYCRAAGWELAAANAQLQIFCSGGENPIPIETDALLQVENVHRAFKKTFLPTYIAIMLLGILNLCTRLMIYRIDPIEALSANSGLYLVINSIVLILLGGSGIFGYLRWHRRAKAAAETDGSFVETRSNRNFQKLMLAIVIIGFLLWFFTLGSWLWPIAAMALVMVTLELLLVFGVKALLKRLGAPARAGFAAVMISAVLISVGLMAAFLAVIFIGVDSGRLGPDEPAGHYEYMGSSFPYYRQALPLTVEDLVETDYGDYSCRLSREESVFLTRIEGRQDARIGAFDEPEISYTVLIPGLSLIYGICLEDALEHEPLYQALMPLDPAPWRAEEVWQLYSGEHPLNSYVIAYKDRVVSFRADWELTQGQIDTAANIFQSSDLWSLD